MRRRRTDAIAEKLLTAEDSPTTFIQTDREEVMQLARDFRALRETARALDKVLMDGQEAGKVRIETKDLAYTIAADGSIERFREVLATLEKSE